MKRFLPILLVLLSFLLLASCTQQFPYMGSDAAREGWHKDVETDPHAWTRGADSWFLIGAPNKAELQNRHAPYAEAISTTLVRVSSDFSNIKASGDFQVQIFGADHNSVYVYGPNAGTQQVAVTVSGNTLCVTQTQPMSHAIMNRVIVRIGVTGLHKLIQEGEGRIEVIHIQSPNLSITSTTTGTGPVYLSGHVNLRHVKQVGTGTINVLGAYTPALDIETFNGGVLNISGNVGVRSIKHYGTSDINIVGANSDSLTVYTEGEGKIGISGTVNVRQIIAKDHTCVYIYALCGNHIDVDMRGSAHVGLSGSVNDLNVSTFDASRFDGRYLCTVNAFVKAHGKSHINLTASGKVFATADQSSSIYFFGPANLLSPFVKGGSSSIIAIDGRYWCNINSEYRPYAYTPTNGQELGYPRRMKGARMNYKGE